MSVIVHSETFKPSTDGIWVSHYKDDLGAYFCATMYHTKNFKFQYTTHTEDLLQMAPFLSKLEESASGLEIFAMYRVDCKYIFCVPFQESEDSSFQVLNVIIDRS